jgi:hypothetical protein
MAVVTGCGPQIETLSGEPHGANFALPSTNSGDDIQINSWLGVEDVVQKFQLAPSDPAGKMTDAEIAARLAAMPRLDEIVPQGRAQLMEGLDPSVVLQLNAPGTSSSSSSVDELEAQREVIDLRAFDTGIRDQGPEGLCTSFAAVAAVENLANRAFKRPLNLSERAHWRNYREYSAYSSLVAARNYALIPEDVWPYGRSSPVSDPGLSKTARIRSYEELETSHSEVISSLRQGFPVVIAMGVNRSLMDPADGGIVRAGRASGGAGHAITMVGAIIDQRVPGGGYYIIKNSWGSDYGDKGYAYVAFDYCEMTYCYVWKVNEVGVFRDGVEVSSLNAPDDTVVPTPAPTQAPVPAPTPPPKPRITAQDFRLAARAMDLYGRREDQGFYLSIIATPDTLREVASVEYWTSNAYRRQGYFKVTSGAMSPTDVDARAFDSMFYPASYDGWTTFPARVTLRDGRKLEIPGVLIDF